jgi:type I restriction enzyme S subunit
MKWKKVKLTEICKPKQWKNLPISELSSEGYPVYGANGIIGRYKEYNHEFPTLAITCRGATCGTINITEPKSYITSNTMALDDIREDVDQKFLYYALNKRGFKDVITGAAQPQITREGLSKIVLDIPESKEYQLHIANILSKAENLIAQRKESIRLLDEFLKSTFLEMFGDPVRNEKGWEMVILGEVCKKIGSGSTPKGGKESYHKEGISLIRSLNVHNDEFVYKDLAFIDENQAYELRNVVIEQDDVLLNITGASVARCCIVPNEILPARVNQHVSILRPEKEMLNPFFLSRMLTSRNYQLKLVKDAKSKGATREAITKEELEQMKVIAPPISLQTQFSQIVEKTEALKTQYQQSLQELENLYGSLSQKAFRGELTKN